MSVAQAPSKPRKSKKARKTDPTRIYQMVVYERQTSGPRGAANRVAEQTGLSDDTIRRIIARIEKPNNTPAELAYKPYDATYEARLHILNAPIVKTAQAAAVARKTPQMRLSTATYVETTPQETPQNEPAKMRPLMSPTDFDNAALEREMRSLAPDEVGTTPQTKTAEYRILERGTLPQQDAATSQISEHLAPSADTENPTAQNAPEATELTRPAQLHLTQISMHTDYVRRRTAPKQRPTSAISLHIIAEQFLQPGPILAVVLFALLIGLIYWK